MVKEDPEKIAKETYANKEKFMGINSDKDRL